MSYTELGASVKALQEALDELTAPYKPPPEEVVLLERALALLLQARGCRQFEADEETVWDCHGITIEGEDRGAWEIRLVPTLQP